MTLTRYNEIMDRVKVTPELRERVLTGAAQAAEAAAGAQKRRGAWRPWVLAAACLALVLLGSLTLPRLGRSPETAAPTEVSEVQGGWDAVEYDTIRALTEAAGFPVEEVPALRDAAGKSYLLIGGELAEITYTVSGNRYYYRVSPGSGDNSGDYNDYPTERTVELEGVSVTFKGEGGACRLALWEANGFACSLACDNGVPQQDLEALVRSVIRP
jgi:hypothetical protein